VLADFIRQCLVAGRMRTDFEPNLNDVGNRHTISSDNGPEDRLLKSRNSHKDIRPVFGAVWSMSALLFYDPNISKQMVATLRCSSARGYMINDGSGYKDFYELVEKGTRFRN
jgi:hypothetical protein